ncbi:MAG: hypothetical protein ACOYUZ_04450 [Patescibacteria group bacterium]
MQEIVLQVNTGYPEHTAKNPVWDFFGWCTHLDSSSHTTGSLKPGTD